MSGYVELNRTVLKQLRKLNGLSQEQLAFSCSEQMIFLSLSTIKRAETGKSVLYRSASQFARFYKVPMQQLLVGQASANAA